MRNEIIVFSLCFRLISFSFRFRCENKRKNTFFASKRTNFISFRFEAKIMAFFRFCFASFRFEAKMMGVFRFRFALLRFEAKMIAIFRFFFVLFPLRSIFVSLQIPTFRIDAKEAKKTLFFALMRKKFRFRFASFRFEAKMTAHPTRMCKDSTFNYERSSNNPMTQD